MRIGPEFLDLSAAGSCSVLGAHAVWVRSLGAGEMAMFTDRARVISCAAGVALLLGTLSTAAHAVTFGFTNITNNSGIAGQVGTQLSVDVTEVVGGKVRFE